MRPAAALSALALLAACTDPRTACEAAAGRQLATLDALIARTAAELKRGYAETYMTVPVVFDVPCAEGDPGAAGGVPFCPVPDVRGETRRVPVDPGDWQARLGHLRALRPGTAQAAEARLAACAGVPMR